MEPKIELAKIRDFGEIINDTFIFVRQNIKPLLINHFVFCGFFMVANVLLQSMVQPKASTFFSNIGRIDPSRYFDDNAGSILNFVGTYLLLMLFLSLSYLVSVIAALCFIALYKEKGNQVPTTEEVWRYLKYYFWRIFGSSILISIMLGFSVLFCVIPSFYLFPIFSLIFCIMIFENSSFGYALNRSFAIIKDNWWTTFGCVVVIYIIQYFGSFLVLLPTSIMTGVNAFIAPQKVMNQPMALIIATGILQQLATVFVLLPVVTKSLCYFSLTESKDGTNLLERITKLGEQRADDNHPAEEY